MNDISTIRLFDDAPYQEKFRANVIFVSDDYIVLDKTLFYPTSGNQDCDLGTINYVSVSSVSLKLQEQDRNSYVSLNHPIKHYLDTSVFYVGQNVEGVINMNRRISIMKLHSASHIVEYFISKLDGFKSVEGSFVSMEKDRTDYKFDIGLTKDIVKKIESDVNDLILQNNDITMSTSAELRYWHCDNIKMLCCGTHVHNTNEIGKITLSRKNKGKGINRVEIKLVV